jgi:hypothetical protein
MRIAGTSINESRVCLLLVLLTGLQVVHGHCQRPGARSTRQWDLAGGLGAAGDSATAVIVQGGNKGGSFLTNRPPAAP